MSKVFLRIMLLTVVSLIAASVLFGQIDPMLVENQAGFGAVGIAFGQSSKLNVYVDIVDPNFFPPGPCRVNTVGAFPPGPCTPGPWRVTMTVFNGDGSVLVQSVQSLGLHQAATLDYTPTDLPFAPIRKRVRPVVTIDPDSNGFVPSVKQTFEIFDSKIRTKRYRLSGRRQSDKSRKDGSVATDIWFSRCRPWTNGAAERHKYRRPFPDQRLPPRTVPSDSQFL